MIKPGNLGNLLKSLYFLSRLKSTQNIWVWLQFSSNLRTEEFRFFNINSPSLFSPTLSKFSINNLVRSYSVSSNNLSSLTSLIISLHCVALSTIVMKYFANLKGIS